MNITQFKPTAGNILVKKLPDDTVTKSGIILPNNVPINKQIVYVEVIDIGEDISENMRVKIEVKPGDKALMGRVPYDGIAIDDIQYWVVKQADIIAVLED